MSLNSPSFICDKCHKPANGLFFIGTPETVNFHTHGYCADCYSKKILADPLKRESGAKTQ